MADKEQTKEEKQAPDQIDPLTPTRPVEHPAPSIPAPETEEGEEFRRDIHTGAGSKFKSSPPASVVPPSKKNSDVY